MNDIPLVGLLIGTEQAALHFKVKQEVVQEMIIDLDYENHPFFIRLRALLKETSNELGDDETAKAFSISKNALSHIIKEEKQVQQKKIVEEIKSEQSHSESSQEEDQQTLKEELSAKQEKNQEDQLPKKRSHVETFGGKIPWNPKLGYRQPRNEKEQILHELYQEFFPSE